jgi:glyoxylase-like metal-dependent hydrolase (beta-lactamase superfamily II)
MGCVDTTGDTDTGHRTTHAPAVNVTGAAPHHRDGPAWRSGYDLRMMEIAPAVHAIRLRGSTGFLLAEERLTLIDAGLAGSRRPLEQYLRGIGRSLDELDRIVCTHGHPDHVGGVREIADATGGRVEVFLHPADLAGIGVTLREVVRTRRRGHLLHFLTPHPGDTTPVQDGDVIGALGGLEVIHTPGHTPGSICLWAPERRILFTGDVLQVIRRRLTYASPVFSHDYPRARASLARLVDLDVELIALSHYPPWRRDAQGTLRALVAEAATG